MKKRMFFLTVSTIMMCLLFVAVLVWGMVYSTRYCYEGYVVDHTEDGLIIEVEVKVSPEEMITYEPGDPYTIGGK